MYDLNQIDVLDFYYNGKFLSSFNAFVGGESGFNNYTLTPNIVDTTETINSIDGEFIVNSRMESRSWTLPILLQDNTKLRELGKHLSSKTEKLFFFKGDRIGINAKYNSSIDFDFFLQLSTLEVKFKASNPYYFELNPTHYIVTKNTSASPYYYDQLKDLVENTPIDYETFSENIISFETNSLTNVSIYNAGNESSKPQIKLYGTGDLTFGLNGFVCTVSGVSEYVVLDFKYYNVYKDNTNMFPNLTINNGTMDEFEMMPEWNSISCSSNISKIEVLPRSRWI